MCLKCVFNVFWGSVCWGIPRGPQNTIQTHFKNTSNTKRTHMSRILVSPEPSQPGPAGVDLGVCLVRFGCVWGVFGVRFGSVGFCGGSGRTTKRTPKHIPNTLQTRFKRIPKRSTFPNGLQTDSQTQSQTDYIPRHTPNALRNTHKTHFSLSGHPPAYQAQIFIKLLLPRILPFAGPRHRKARIRV